MDIHAEGNGVFSILQEKIQIADTVVDKNGEPIIGATVVIVETAQGTNTDLEGKFILIIPSRESRWNFAILDIFPK